MHPILPSPDPLSARACGPMHAIIRVFCFPSQEGGMDEDEARANTKRGGTNTIELTAVLLEDAPIQLGSFATAEEGAALCYACTPDANPHLAHGRGMTAEDALRAAQAEELGPNVPCARRPFGLQRRATTAWAPRYRVAPADSALAQGVGTGRDAAGYTAPF
jgi:hypothetical protein